MKGLADITGFAAITLCAFLPVVGQAAEYRVTRFDDPIPNGCLRFDCSLREAVIAANATTAADLITLQAGTYTLTQAPPGADTELGRDLDVTHSLQIVGQGPENTIVRNGIAAHNPDGRVISVVKARLTLSGVGLRDGNLYSSSPMNFVYGGCLQARDAGLVLANVTLSNCKSDGLAAFGGAISASRSTLHLTDVVLEDNIGSIGGALMLQSSTARSTNVRIARNIARNGGAIAARGEVGLTGSGVELIANSASASGGAISVSEGASRTLSTTLRWAAGSRIAENTAGYGGAISVSVNARLEIAPAPDGTSGPTDLLRVEDNHATQAGGGIHVADYEYVPGNHGALVAHRIALRRNLTDGNGAGVHSRGETTVVDSEIVDNVAASDGGGIFLAGAAPTRIVERSSVARNQSGGLGGGIAIDVPAAQLVNVSFHANAAAADGGAIAVLDGRKVDLTHVSSALDGASRGGSLAVGSAGTANLLNTVLAAGCHRGVGSLVVDLGGNAQQLAQPACVGAAIDAAGLALQPGYYGGRFDVLGTGPASLLRNAAPVFGAVPVDVRGYLRGSSRDIGAFDHDASAPTAGQ
jgi:hypothetical protein